MCVCVHVVIVLLQWLQETFLGYLQEWESSVKNRENFTKGEKQLMCLTRETLEGLKITGITNTIGSLYSIGSAHLELLKFIPTQL